MGPRLQSALRRGLRAGLLVQKGLRRRRLKYLFVIGHMRSGSSALMHVLATHPEIAGAGERWIEYADTDFLDELMVSVHEELGELFLLETYVADKVLHDDLMTNTDILTMPDVRSIFLLRKPERTLQSLYAHRGRLLGVTDWESALRHYTGRLEHMSTQARTVGDAKRCFFLAYEALVEEPRRCLDCVSRFLELETSLSERYRITKLTGVAGIGDFSIHIRSGRIERTPPATIAAPPAELLARAEAAYEQCAKVLAAACDAP